jgi:hypothetical protein
MDKDEVLKLLDAACDKLGGAAGFARAHQLTYEYVRAVRAGKRALGPKVLDALGLERCETRYRRKEPDHA